MKRKLALIWCLIVVSIVSTVCFVGCKSEKIDYLEPTTAEVLNEVFYKVKTEFENNVAETTSGNYTRPETYEYNGTTTYINWLVDVTDKTLVSVSEPLNGAVTIKVNAEPTESYVYKLSFELANINHVAYKKADGTTYSYTRVLKVEKIAPPSETDAEKVTAEKVAYEFNQTATALPVAGSTFAEVAISYQSDNTDVYSVATDGTVTVTPATTDTQITLTVTFTCGDATEYITKTFTVNAREKTNAEKLDEIINNMSKEVTESFELDSSVTWTVKEGTAITLNGNQAVVTRPEATESDATVVLTAKLGDATKDVTIKVQKKEATSDLPSPVTAPAVNTPYTFGMIQGKLNDGKIYYLAGGMGGYNNFYLATTDNADNALQVYIENADGGYYFYCYDNQTKKYINMVVSDTHVNGAYAETASTVYTIDENGLLTSLVNSAAYAFGTRNDNTYTTVGPVAESSNGFHCMFYATTAKEITAAEKVAAEKEAYSFSEDATKLPTTGSTYTEVEISYTSSNADVYSVDENGNVTITKQETATDIALTITFKLDDTTETLTKNFTVTAREKTDAEKLEAFISAMELPSEVTDSLTLDFTNVSWTVEEGATAIVINEDKTVTITRPAAGEDDVTVKLIATYGEAKKEINVIVKALPVEDVAGYAYFKNTQLLGAKYYLTGAIANTYYGDTTVTLSDAIVMYKETTTDGYKFYFLEESAKKYIAIVKNNTYFNIKYQENGSVFLFNEEHNYWYTTVDGSECFLGGYKEHKTLSAYAIGYVGNSDYYYMEFVLADEETQITDKAIVEAELGAITVTETITGAGSIDLANSAKVYGNDVGYKWEIVTDASGIGQINANNKLVVTNPTADTTITLKVTVSYNDASTTKTFTVTIKHYETVVGEKNITVDFTKNFATYAKNWGGYATKELTSTDLNTDNCITKITFSNVSKQTTTITDMPVVASKKNTQYVTIQTTGVSIKSATFTLKQWSASKKFTVLTIQYSTDGTNWTETKVGKTSGVEENVASIGDISCTNLPQNVQAVKLVFTSTASGNQQIGIKGFSITAE